MKKASRNTGFFHAQNFDTYIEYQHFSHKTPFHTSTFQQKKQGELQWKYQQKWSQKWSPPLKKVVTFFQRISYCFKGY